MSSTQSILTFSQHCSADDVDTRSTVARVGDVSATLGEGTRPCACGAPQCIIGGVRRPPSGLVNSIEGFQYYCRGPDAMLSTAPIPPRPTIHPPLASPRRSARRAQHGAPSSSSNHPSAAGIASPLSTARSARRSFLLVQPSIRRWHRLAAHGTRVLPACDEAVERGAERRAERVVLSARAAPEAAERLGKLAYLMSEVIREVIKESKERQSGEQSGRLSGRSSRRARRGIQSNHGQSEAIRGNQRQSEALRGTQKQT